MRILLVLLLLISCKQPNVQKRGTGKLYFPGPSRKSETVRVVDNGNFNFYRIENDEAICYTTGFRGGVSCKFKEIK